MQRDLTRLADERFDLLVIGGGITGACIARDAALRGLSVALVEKNDFAHATSAHNSKLIHGGLRYLRNFELRLVRESLRERRIWQRIAPHLVHPLSFLIPLYGAGRSAHLTLSAGLSLYDLLSFDRGWLDDPAQRLPGHRWLSLDAALVSEPVLQGPGFQGAFRYADAQMYSPERLALECVLDANAHGAAVANHLMAERLLLRDGKVEGAQVSDTFGGTRFGIRAETTVIAAGPWADIFLTQALGRPVSHTLTRSKGIHLIVPAMTRGAALTVATDGGHFFLLPWRGHTIIGTTDTPFAGSPDRVGVTETDVRGFLDVVNTHLPAARLKREDVRYAYAGLRPLVDDHTGSTYRASRRAELVDHGKDDGVANLYSAIGGKWTTSRALAAQVVDTLVARDGKSARPCATGTSKLPGAPDGPVTALLDNSGGSTEHLARLYGRRAPQMLALAEADPALRMALSPSGDIAAQVLYATREEMALTLGDVVMRRTGIGQLGPPGGTTLEQTAALMASELDWSGERRAREIADIEQTFALQVSA